MKDRATDSPLQAPGQYLGFAMQAVVFLLELINADEGSTISLEYFGDVAVVDGEGTDRAIEVKSGLHSNPISDRAVGLWKTFSNWVKAVEAGQLHLEDTKFVLYVAQPKRGPLVERFATAVNAEEAAAALAAARHELTDDAKRKVSAEAWPHVEHFLGNESAAIAIITAFELRFGSGSAQADLQSALTKKYILPEHQDSVLHELQGWITDRINTAIEQGEPAAVSVEAFLAEVHSIVRKYNLQAVLVSFAVRPTPEQISANRTSVFVQQLALIDCTDEHQLHAINDYFKAAADRTEWSKRGLVHRSSFQTFEDALCRFWENKREQIQLTHAVLEESKRGHYLYRDCISHERRLQGMETPPHFVPGSYHALADNVVLGWHPQYVDLFREPE